jgi:excisionase family DNA binding protein
LAINKQYLSVAELSSLTGLSEVTIRRRIKDGSIPASQPGGPRTRLVVRRDVLDLLINQNSAPVRVENGATTGEMPEPSGLDLLNKLPGRHPNWMNGHLNIKTR